MAGQSILGSCAIFDASNIRRVDFGFAEIEILKMAEFKYSIYVYENLVIYIY